VNRFRNLLSKSSHSDLEVPTNLEGRMIFTAIILAAQPMTFNELLDLLSVKVGEEPSSRRRRTRNVVLSACSPFIEVDSDKDFLNPTLRLAHKSIRELLLQDPGTLDFVTRDCYKFFVKIKEGNAEIGKRCLAYLGYRRYSKFDNFTSVDDSSDHGLLKYACIYWHTHLDSADPSKEMFESVRKFMKSPNFWTCIRVQSRLAPHMFAKLSYDSRRNSYRMTLTGKTNGTTGEEFYAHTLPEWLSNFNEQGEDLVRSYHMFVREWGDVLVRNPDHVQRYFTKVFGDQTFWNRKSVSEGTVEVKTWEGENAYDELLESYGLETISTSPKLTEDIIEESVEVTADYIKSVLHKEAGFWDLDHSVQIRNGDFCSVVYRYKLQHTSSQDVEAADSDDDISDSGFEDEIELLSSKTKSLWFLSVTTRQGECHWYHHISNSTTVQASIPLFIHNTSLVFWSQDDQSALLIDRDTWASSVKEMPATESTDSILILQGLS